MGSGLACAQDRVEPTFEVWSASKVDWQSSTTNLYKSCEVHWLYDDIFNISLLRDRENGFYFSFEILKENHFSIIRDKKYHQAFLAADNIKHALAITKINLLKTVMTLPRGVNNLSALKAVNRILLEADGVSYHFLLENMNENISYFEHCSGLKIPEVVDGGLLPVDASDLKLPHRLKSKNNTLYGADASALFSSYQGGKKLISNAVDDRAAVIDPVVGDVVISDMGDEKVNLLEDTSFVREASESQKEENKVIEVIGHSEARGNDAPEFNQAFCNDNMPVIQNLTRNLSILEREKEALRLKLLSSVEGGIISDVTACDMRTQGAEKVHYNEIINKLRAENRILKDKLLK